MVDWRDTNLLLLQNKKTDAPSAFSFAGELLDDVESQILDGFCQCVAVQSVALYND